MNQGGLCARGQAAIQVTYHPDRITQPLKRSGDRGARQVRGHLLGRCDGGARVAPRRARDGREPEVAGVSDATPSRPSCGARRAIPRSVRRAAGPIAYELFDDDVLRRANALSFGREQLPTFDLANARYVLSFGADFLGTWNSPVAQGAATGRCGKGDLASAACSSRSSRGCRRPARTPTSGFL